MKTLMAAILIVMSVGTAFAQEDAAKGSEDFCPLDRVNTKANLGDGSSQQDQDETAVSM